MVDWFWLGLVILGDVIAVLLVITGFVYAILKMYGEAQVIDWLLLWFYVTSLVTFLVVMALVVYESTR